MFDFANTQKPILYYTYDLELYRDSVRGFYIDFEAEAPGPFLRNTEEIIDSIQHLSRVEEEYKEKYAAFYNKYCSLGRWKSRWRRIIDHLIENKILNESNKK